MLRHLRPISRKLSASVLLPSAHIPDIPNQSLPPTYETPSTQTNHQFPILSFWFLTLTFMSHHLGSLLDPQFGLPLFFVFWFLVFEYGLFASPYDATQHSFDPWHSLLMQLLYWRHCWRQRRAIHLPPIRP